MGKRIVDLVVFKGYRQEAIAFQGKRAIKSILDILDGLFPEGNERKMIRSKVLDEVNELVRFSQNLIDD